MTRTGVLAMSRLLRVGVSAAIAVMVLGGTLAVAGLGSINLAPKHDYPAGTRPYGVIKADVNGDRKLDLATAGELGVNILLGRGDGTFRAPRTISTPGGLSDLRLTDMNRDGRKDFVAADYGSNAIVVLLRKRGGGYRMPASYPTLDYPYSPVIGDFNRDGRKDVAVAEEGDQYVAVLLGRRGGRLRARTDYRVGNSPYYIAVADYNRDGRKDLAVTVFSNDDVVVLYGRGNGTFGGKRSFPAGDGPYPILARDLNRDRRIDLLVGNYQAGNVVFLKGKSGGFRAPRTLFDQPQVYFLNLTDLDRDGRRDLLSVNINNSDGSGGLAVNRGLGGARFSPSPVYFDTGPTPFSVATGRFNRDRKPDVAVSNSAIGANTVSFFRNRH
jgi:hypothetical protein